jgi:hypothetical protein
MFKLLATTCVMFSLLLGAQFSVASQMEAGVHAMQSQLSGSSGTVSCTDTEESNAVPPPHQPGVAPAPAMGAGVPGVK